MDRARRFSFATIDPHGPEDFAPKGVITEVTAEGAYQILCASPP